MLFRKPTGGGRTKAINQHHKSEEEESDEDEQVHELHLD